MPAVSDAGDVAREKLGPSSNSSSQQEEDSEWLLTMKACHAVEWGPMRTPGRDRDQAGDPGAAGSPTTQNCSPGVRRGPEAEQAGRSGPPHLVAPPGHGGDGVAPSGVPPRRRPCSVAMFMTVQSEVSTNARAPFMLGRQARLASPRTRLCRPQLGRETGLRSRPTVPPDRGRGNAHRDTDGRTRNTGSQRRLAEAELPNPWPRHPQ